MMGVDNLDVDLGGPVVRNVRCGYFRCKLRGYFRLLGTSSFVENIVLFPTGKKIIKQLMPLLWVFSLN